MREFTFQDQPVDLFSYRQAFKRCVATIFYMQNDNNGLFPSLPFFLYAAAWVISSLFLPPFRCYA